MEKYATYELYKHKVTGELKRVPLSNDTELEKTAEDSSWIKVEGEDDNY